MTELSPADATSKTKGFYPLATPERAQRSSASEVRRTMARISNEAVNDEHPAPFKLTKLSPEDERTVAEHDLRVVLQRAGRKVTQKPVLWVDGPVDLALTTLAILQRGTPKNATSVVPHTAHYVKTRATNVAWERARDVAASLPEDLVRKKGAPRYDGGHYYDTVKPLVEGSLTRFYGEKLAENLRMLPAEYQSSVSDVPGLVSRLNRLTPIQALLANTTEYPLRPRNSWGDSGFTSSGAAAFGEVRNRVGDARADMVAVLNALLCELQIRAVRDKRSRPGDLHGLFNLNNAEALSRIMFAQRAVREVTMGKGSNWQDPERELLLRCGLGITAHVSLSSMEILCHAPSTYVENASALTLENVGSLLDKPTVRWDDGSEFYIYDGVELNPEVVRETIKKPSGLLSIRNAEQRRVLLRLVGAETLLADVNAKTVSKDDFGELFTLPNGSQFVVVDNATPEHDGSTRKYILGTVGNQHKTARSGVASTWGLREDQYWPTKET